MIIKKRTIVIISFMLVGTFMSHAQNDNPFKFGIKAGAIRSDIANSNSKSKIGLVGGFFTQYRFSEKIAMRSELLYGAYGAKPRGADNMNLNYIQVLPSLLKVYPTNKLAVETGPYASYLVSTKGLDKSNFKKLDYGATLGLSYDITSQLEIEARYNMGIRDITKTIGRPKNRAIQVTLSYGF
ncbi:porin family protein [Aquimarina litoralis]|uniref:porin family protein n=1 Tax=Aquimarina litoralis TaxID=584605 RepID=UPI001C583E77|nr:porin family protein [Aquimarina litoralis]MBW1299008.1 outer membrane beta-barrel protein [Aquimarina litoralis]